MIWKIKENERMYCSNLFSLAQTTKPQAIRKEPKQKEIVKLLAGLLDNDFASLYSFEFRTNVWWWQRSDTKDFKIELLWQLLWRKSSVVSFLNKIYSSAWRQTSQIKKVFSKQKSHATEKSGWRRKPKNFLRDKHSNEARPSLRWLPNKFRQEAGNRLLYDFY